jgi:NADPH-dependent curcumin reductase CurA
MQYVTAWGALVEQAKLGEGDFVIVTAAPPAASALLPSRLREWSARR